MKMRTIRLAGFYMLLNFGVLAAGCSLTPPPAPVVERPPGVSTPAGGRLTLMSWNIRGYPEKAPANTAWAHAQIARLLPDVFCMQEIANQENVRTFLSNDGRLKRWAFKDSQDGMDNAIFTTEGVLLQDLPDPVGFQHPAQAAFIASGGFDAAIITVHLSWTNRAMRETEMALLRGVVNDMSRYDPDVILVGDFNLKEPEIAQLAQGIGMVVMLPVGQDGVGTTQAGNRYDHFVISADLADEEAMGCRIQTFTGDDQAISKKVSDHLPITAWFKTDEQYRDRPRP